MALCWICFRATSIIQWKRAEEDIRYVFYKERHPRGGPDPKLTSCMENGASEFPI